MLEHLRAPFKKLIEPLAKALISIGLTANAVTVIGTIGTIVVAFVAGITGWLFAGAVVLTLLVLADSLDGSIAKLTTGGTQFGAFLDSTLDRIADWALLAGVIVFFILHADWWYDISQSSPDYISWVGVGGHGVDDDVVCDVVCACSCGICWFRGEERHRNTRRQTGHHFGGHGDHWADASRLMVGHWYGTACGFGCGHSVPAYSRSASTDDCRP